MIDTLEQFMRVRNPPQQLIDGLITEGELSMLFGESGVGKSFFAIDLALCVASGLPWNGRNVSQGTVLYLPSEGFDGFRDRLKAWCKRHGISIEGLPVHMGSYEFALNDNADFKEFEEYLCAIRPRPKLVVIDTLTGMTQDFDQNSAKDMAAFADTCKMIKLLTDAAVLVVHHSGHKDKGRSKGAVDFWAACDKVLGMKRAGRDGTLAIECKKNRNGEPFDDIQVKIEQFEPAAVLVPAEKPKTGPSSTLNRGDGIFRDVISKGPISEAEAKAVFCEQYGKSAGANRNAWNRARQKAESAGLLEIDSDGLISTNAQTTHD